MKILFCGATGYGNVGDEAYKLIFQEHLKGHELYFNSPYPDLDMVDMCDFLVVGGGGLIYGHTPEHFKYFQMYMDRAIETGKPYAFISVGCQVLIPYLKMLKKLDDTRIISAEIECWKPYFDRASVITVRAKYGCDAIKRLTNTPVFVYPDLVYLLKPVDYHLTPPIKNLIIIDDTVLENIKEFKEYLNEPRTYVVTFSPENNDTLFKFRGEITPHTNLYDRKNLSPQEALRLVVDSENVITCRYHGLVMANSYDKPVKVVACNLKTYSEVKPQNKLDAIGHINKLKEVLR